MTDRPALLQLIDACIAQQKDPTYLSELRQLRDEANAEIARHLAELQQVRDDAAADKRQLQAKHWLERLIFVLSKLLDHHDSLPPLP